MPLPVLFEQGGEFGGSFVRKNRRAPLRVATPVVLGMGSASSVPLDPEEHHQSPTRSGWVLEVVGAEA